MKTILVVLGTCLSLSIFIRTEAQTPDTAELERVWTKCASCHSRDAASKDGIGPNLGALAGRRAGRRPGFKYSPAFRSASFEWNVVTLNEFIADPQQVVPGTVMAFSGLRNPRDRALIVCLLLNACSQIPTESKDPAGL